MFWQMEATSISLKIEDDLNMLADGRRYVKRMEDEPNVLATQWHQFETRR
jgi:hypothetical protein